MINFKVDQDRCVNCGLCSSDCPVMIINNKTEFPTIKEGKEEHCLKCQHCLAICPYEAISIWDKNPKDCIQVTDRIPDPNEMGNLMKTRRSIRQFKDEEVDRELIRNMISIASYAPTSQNENSVQFNVVDNKNDLKKFRDLVYSYIKKAYQEEKIPKSRLMLNNFQNLWHSKQIDVIFRDAPHLLIASAPRDGDFVQIDCGIAISYFDLLANSNGIGTLWNGFVKWVLEDIAPEIKREIGIPENHEVAAVLLFGIPAVKYARSIQNDNPNIQRICL